MHVDLQPLVLALAGVVIALTPVGVAYLGVQVRLLTYRADAIEKSAAADREQVRAGLNAVQNTVRSSAADTQATVKAAGGGA